MKKVIFASILLAISMIFGACSNNSFYLSDSQIINVQFDKVLESLEKGDSVVLKGLFSPNAIEQSENFDESVELLFEYYQGVDASYTDDGPLTAEKSQDYGIERKVIDKTYDVTTTVDTYRFAISFVATDNADAGNVGIWSLYVIKMKDDPEQDCAYWGDGKNTPGINIGISGSQ